MGLEQTARLTERLEIKGYAVDGKRFSTGRSVHLTLPAVTRGNQAVVAKHYPSGEGAVTFRNLQELWRSSFGASRRLPGLPRPIEYLADIDVLIMERIDGRPMLELDPLDMSVLDNAIELIAALHDSNAHPEKPRGAVRIIRSLRRKARVVAAANSPYKEEFATAVDGLEGMGVEDGELVPCHGDFSPRNVLVGSTGLALIDWDRLRRADPARDIAYMGCWYWASAIRRGELPAWSILDRMTSNYEAHRPGAGLAGRMNFHVAAGLLRMAHSRIMNKGSEGYLVPHLIEEALCKVK